MISTIIVQYNHSALTARAVETLLLHQRAGADVVVVDNGSTEPGTRAATEKISGCRFIFNPQNAGFGSANNTGARDSRGDILLFLNNDTLIHAPILPAIESYFEDTPSCGAAGLRLLNSDGTIQNSTGRFPTVWGEWRVSRGRVEYSDPFEVRRDWVSGAALAVRRSVFERVGGFDERYFMYFEDVDICRRISGAGHEIHYIADVAVEHIGGGSQEGGIPPAVLKEYRRSQLLYYSRHASAADNVLLRAYLFAKFLPGRFSADRETREVAAYVQSLLFRSPQ